MFCSPVSGSKVVITQRRRRLTTRTTARPISMRRPSKDGSFEIFVNDITTDTSAAKARAELTDRGIDGLFVGASPGTVTFVDAKTRRRLAEITVAHQNEEILKVLGLARSRAVHE